MKRTSFEKDSTGENAELFLKVRDFIKVCIGNDVKDNYTHSGWFRGRHIDDKHNLLFGDGKSIRGQKSTNSIKPHATP